MTRTQALLAGLVLLVTVCATTPTFHSGPTSLTEREKRAMLATARVRGDGFDRFWMRPRCRIGLIKWSEQRSQAAKEVPPILLDLVRDEVGRVNRGAHEGETVFVSVTVFEWNKRWFGRAPRVGYEVVGRDRAGQVMWMGEDRMVAPRKLAVHAAEGDEVVVARELGRRLRAELGR